MRCLVEKACWQIGEHAHTHEHIHARVRVRAHNANAGGVFAPEHQRQGCCRRWQQNALRAVASRAHDGHAAILLCMEQGCCGTGVADLCACVPVSVSVCACVCLAVCLCIFCPRKCALGHRWDANLFLVWCRVTGNLSSCLPPG